MFRRNKTTVEERLDELEWQVSVNMDQLANLQEAIITLNQLELDRICEINKPIKAKKGTK